MNLNDAEVTRLLDACVKDGSLVITDNRRLRLKKKCCIPEFHSDEKMHEFLSLVVPNKSVTAEAAARMEEVLNLYCSEENLHELMDVLIGLSLKWRGSFRNIRQARWIGRIILHFKVHGTMSASLASHMQVLSRNASRR